MNEGLNAHDYSEEDLLSTLHNALKSEDKEQLESLVADRLPSELAEMLNLCHKEDRINVISALGEYDPEILPEMFSYLDSEVKEQVISLIGTIDSAEAIGKLESDEAVQFVEDLSEEKISEILRELPHHKRVELKNSLSFPEDSAARIANRQFVTVGKGKQVGDIIDFLRSSEDLPQDFYTIFILDDEQKPVSFVPLSRIMRNRREVDIDQLSEEIIKAIDLNTDQEEVANIFQKYGLISAPVVDSEGKIFGVITIDDVANVIEEEVQEDIMHLAGLKPESDILSEPFKKFKNRSPWLLVNLVTSILASLVISLFEGEIQSLVALAVLMPIVASMSGNAGSQTLTVAVRALATKELMGSNYYKILNKELLSSLINGIIFGSVVFLASYLLYSNLSLGIIIFTAVILTFLLASLSGLTIPIIMNRMGFDPAVSSSALVYAITDMSSFFIFLGLASLLLI